MANSPSGTSTSVRGEVGCLSVKLGKAGFGGGQGRFFFAECKADLLGAVARVVVKAGAGNGGHADLFDEIFREGDVFCSRSKTPRVRIREARNVRHDVVRAAWLEHREARSLQDFQQPHAFLGVTRGKCCNGAAAPTVRKSWTLRIEEVASGGAMAQPTRHPVTL